MTIGHDPDAGEANAQAAAVIVKSLYGLGVRHAVVSPGSRNTPVVLALHSARSAFADFAVTVVVDERSAAFFALGLARSTGRPVVLSCSSGSAGAHYHPALVEADRAGVPLIAITADRPPELHDRGAPQTVNQQRMFEPHVRASVNLPVSGTENAASAARAAAASVMHAASGPGRGPVHLNMQCREPLWPHGWSANQLIQQLERARVPARPVERQTEFIATLSPLLEELQAVERGVILAGPVELARFADGDALEEYRAAIVSAADQLKWPILADPASQLRGGCPDDFPPIVENYDLVLRSTAFREAMRPDAVLAFGDWPTSKLLGQYLAHHRPALRSVPLSPGLRDPWDLSGAELTTAPASERSRGTWAKAWGDAREAASELVSSRSDGLWEGHIAQVLQDSLSSGFDVHVGSSMPIRDLDAFMGTYSSDAVVYASRGANGIDGTIATAAGEAMGTGRPLIAWMGDLTFLHDASSLAWIPQGVPLTLVISDNGGGGIFHHLPIAANAEVFEPYFLTPPSVDVAAVASGFGWDVEIVSDRASLHDALRDSAKGARRVIVARIDRDENLRIHREIWHQVANKVDGLFADTTSKDGAS